MTDTAHAGTPHEDRIPVDLDQPIVLAVHNPNGDVTVRAADRSDVLIRHVTPGLSEDLGVGDVELMIDVHNNRIEARANPGVGGGWAGGPSGIDLDAVIGQITSAFQQAGPWASAKAGKVHVAAGRHAWCDITIEVPRASSGRVEIRTASGDVRVEGITSELALNTASGDVRVVRTEGDLVIQTASGDLGIEGACGRLTAHTVSGDVHVTTSQVNGFHIQTANGDILLDAMLAGDGPFHAQTVSGDVGLTLRRPTAAGEAPAATLAFQTVSGDAHVTQPFRQTAHRLWQAGSGESGPRIEVSTVSGDLAAAITAFPGDAVGVSRPTSTMDAAPPVPLIPPAPPVPARPLSPTEPPPPPVSWSRGEGDLAATDDHPAPAQPAVQDDAARLAVLEAVERGEIDVEEALRQLDAADSMTSP